MFNETRLHGRRSAHVQNSSRDLKLAKQDALHEGRFAILSGENIALHAELGDSHENHEALHEIAKYFVDPDPSIQYAPYAEQLHTQYRLHALDYKAYIASEFGINLEHTEALAILEAEVRELQERMRHEYQDLFHRHGIEDAQPAEYTDVPHPETMPIELPIPEENKGE